MLKVCYIARSVLKMHHRLHLTSWCPVLCYNFFSQNRLFSWKCILGPSLITVCSIATLLTQSVSWCRVSCLKCVSSLPLKLKVYFSAVSHVEIELHRHPFCTKWISALLYISKQPTLLTLLPHPIKRTMPDDRAWGGWTKLVEVNELWAQRATL